MNAPSRIDLKPLLTLPLRLFPNAGYATATALVLNQVMERELADGELEFLRGRRICLQIRDLGIDIRLTVEGEGFEPVSSRAPEDVRISGNLAEFYVLAMREEDPDTLFFNRRLKIEGNTAIGLQLKNFLDSIELPIERLPAWLRRNLDRGASLLRLKSDQSAAAA